MHRALEIGSTKQPERQQGDTLTARKIPVDSTLHPAWCVVYSLYRYELRDAGSSLVVA